MPQTNSSQTNAINRFWYQGTVYSKNITGVLQRLRHEKFLNPECSFSLIRRVSVHNPSFCFCHTDHLLHGVQL